MEQSDELTDDLAGVEPKLRAAILRMRKLDRILVKKMDREKKVKRDSILLQKRYFSLNLTMIFSS